jgi:hemerythrin-like domain-containing protein
MEQFSAQGFGHQAEKPTQILSDEHRIIERVLDAVQRLTLAPARQNLPHWQEAIEFIRGFADQCHHCKEEQVLFPALEAHGIPTEGGPVGMMLQEHEEGRALVRGMMDALARIDAGDDSAEAGLFDSARQYLRLLREHIQKEDEVLFRMADEVIPADEQKRLLEEFENHEVKEMGAGAHEKFLKIAAELEGATG